MYKEDLALNNLPELICHKTQPKQTKPKTNMPRFSDVPVFKRGFCSFSVRSTHSGDQPEVDPLPTCFSVAAVYEITF